MQWESPQNTLEHVPLPSHLLWRAGISGGDGGEGGAMAVKVMAVEAMAGEGDGGDGDGDGDGGDGDGYDGDGDKGDGCEGGGGDGDSGKGDGGDGDSGRGDGDGGEGDGGDGDGLTSVLRRCSGAPWCELWGTESQVVYRRVKRGRGVQVEFARLTGSAPEVMNRF